LTDKLSWAIRRKQARMVRRALSNIALAIVIALVLGMYLLAMKLAGQP